MLRRLLLGLIGVLVLTACGARWHPAKPRVVRLGGADLALEAALVTLDGDGYRVARRHTARGLIIAKSKVDQKDSYYSSGARPDHRTDEDDERVSWIALQIYSDGSLHATAWGHLVKQDQGVMHRKLAAEIDALLEHIVHNAKAIYHARYGSPYAHPSPAH